MEEEGSLALLKSQLPKAAKAILGKGFALVGTDLITDYFEKFCKYAEIIALKSILKKIKLHQPTLYQLQKQTSI